jgi:hypothetical protein
LRTRLVLARRLARVRVLPVLTRVAAAAFVIVGAGICGVGTASADDYTALLIHPNQVTDSNAYTAGPATMDPNGQPGAQVVYTHRDGTRAITDTVQVLPDPVAATAAMNAAQSSSGIANPTSAAVPVGTGGTLLTGTGPNGQSVSVLLFTQGDMATTVQFDGPANDPVPKDMVIDFGQQQDNAIKAWQP